MFIIKDTKGQKMKNKIIVSLIFIIPIAIYFILLTINPDKALDMPAEAKEIPQVLMFSTPMCGECRKMVPVIDRAKQTYKDRVEIIKIDASERNAKTQKLVSKYRIYVVPTFIYIDRTGNNINRTEGSMSYEEFEKYIKDLEK